VWMRKLDVSCCLMSAQMRVEEGSKLSSSLASNLPMRALEKKPMQQTVHIVCMSVGDQSREASLWPNSLMRGKGGS
jgi:hypothetical protein